LAHVLFVISGSCRPWLEALRVIDTFGICDITTDGRYPDGDNLDNFDEWRFLSNPHVADSDGDGVGDGAEIEQGSHPAFPEDAGQAPPPEDAFLVKVIVGDPSSSHSERWRVEAKDIATGKTVLRHASRQYGEMSPEALSTFDQFKPGRAYRFKLRHGGTDPEKLKNDPEGEQYPDYDWSLQISYKHVGDEFINLASPAQTEYRVIDPYNERTRSLSTDTPFLLAPESPFTTIGAGRAAKYNYEDKIFPMSVVLLPLSITPDSDRDGKIDYSDRHVVTAEKPWRFWTNDDNDSGATEGDDIPQTPGTQGTNGYDHTINGIRDLVDFFPLDLNLQAALEIYPQGKFRYRLTHAAPQNAPCFKIAQARTLVPADSDAYLKDLDTAAAANGQECLPIHTHGRNLDASFLDAQEQGNGLLLVEAIRPTSSPIKLAIIRNSDQNVMAETTFHVSVSSVENMFRHKNLRSGAESTEADKEADYPPAPDRFDSPTNFPDEICNEDWLVFLHGYNVNGKSARGWHSEAFKRLFWSGSKSKFVGISWYGDESQRQVGQDTVCPKYYENVENALNIGAALSALVNDLAGGKKYVATHSLGGLVASYAIAHEGMDVETAFMFDPALPTEALLPKNSILNDPQMEPSAWREYPEAIKTSEWYSLFPVADKRSELTWRGLLHPAVPNLKVFFSGGEEALGALPLNIPPDPGWAADSPRGQYAFAIQAMLKGAQGNEPAVSQESFLGELVSILSSAFGGLSPASEYGGWKWTTGAVSPFYGIPNAEGGITRIDAVTFDGWLEGAAGVTFRQRLQGDPISGLEVPSGCENLYDPQLGSGVAATAWKRHRIFAQMIPERTLPAGGVGGSGMGDGEVVSLKQKFAIIGESNIEVFDMPENRNGWPASRNTARWLHGDIREVAYTHVWKSWQEIVNDGDLDREPEINN